MSMLNLFRRKKSKFRHKMEKIGNILSDDFDRPICQRPISEERISVMEEKFKKCFVPITPIYFCILNKKRYVIDGQHRLEVYSNHKDLHNEMIPIVDIKVKTEQEINDYFFLINEQLPLLEVYKMKEDIKEIIMKTFNYFRIKYPKSFHNKDKHKTAYKPYIWDTDFMNQLTNLVKPDGEYDLINKFGISTSDDFIEILEKLNLEYSKKDNHFFKCARKTLEKVKKSNLLYFGLYKNYWFEAFIDGTIDLSKLEPNPPMSQALRFECWNKYIGVDMGKAKCWCCNQIDIWQQQFQAGHVKAKNLGGKNIVSNLRPICSNCNQGMGTKNMFDYMREKGYNFDKKSEKN